MHRRCFFTNERDNTVKQKKKNENEIIQVDVEVKF